MPTTTKPDRRRSLTPAQGRLIEYLDRVGAATEAGIYDAGVSDATKRTLRSLVEPGFVVPVELPGGPIVYRLRHPSVRTA